MTRTSRVTGDFVLLQLFSGAQPTLFLRLFKV